MGGVKFLMYPRFMQVFLDKQVEGMSKHKEVYVTPSHTKKVFANMKRPSKGFSGRITPLFQTMMVQALKDMAKEITSLKKRVNQLEKRKKSRPLGLIRLRKVCSSSRVESFNDASLGAQKDASKQGRKIEDLDADTEQQIESKNVVEEPVVSVATTTKLNQVSAAEVVTTPSANVEVPDELTL
ncbi:hypothetical protein Tco_0035961, partial [Tanacetum coccineum]